MELIINKTGKYNIAEIKSKRLILESTEDFLDLMGNANYLEAERLIIYKTNLPDSFFDLKTKVAGEILQKFSTYQQKLAIIGDFSNVKSKSLKDFIRESNRIGRILFLECKEKAIEKLS